MTIDQDHVAHHIAAPQDDELLRLGQELNATYMAYGAEGEASVARQHKADKSAAKMNKKVALERNSMKSKKGYDNASWDLVDAVDKDARFLEKAKDSQLPAAMRGKSLEEKKKIVAANAAKRAEIKAKIATLEADRKKHVAAEEAKQGADTAKSLDSELMKATKKSAAKKGYK
jgi:hypothetical protein